MDGQRTPRAPDPIDAASPVSLGRDYLQLHPEGPAAHVVRAFLRWHEAIAAAAGVERVPYDRQLVAAMLRSPQRYRSDVVAMQAALVAGCCHPDTPMDHPPLAKRLAYQDDGS